MSEIDNLEVLTVEEVSNMLRVDERTIYRKCENNEIPFFRVGESGSIRFLKTKILEWIEQQQS